MSFGFKHGIPLDADMVLDVRFIPNPFYVSGMRKLTGKNRKVKKYVLDFAECKSFIDKAIEMISEIIPGYIKEGKYHLNIAVGCTGGRHRSVAITNEIGTIFSKQGRRTVVSHRDIKN